MNKKCYCMIILLVITLNRSPIFGLIVESKEFSGRGEEVPVAILADQEGFTIAFQEPARIIRYDNEWNEIKIADFPEDYLASEMIIVHEFIWLLDERQGLILQVDAASLVIIASFESEFAYEFVGIFEMNELVFVMDETGCIRQVNEEFTLLGWLSGARVYQAITYDGYFVYIAGRLQLAGSGVLVKTIDNEKEAEWLMSDDPDTRTYVDTVKQIRLLSDGYFYVVYRDTGIAKYDADGVYQSTVYPETNKVRAFADLAYHPVSERYYLLDRKAGVFEATWPEAKDLDDELDDEELTFNWDDYDWFNMTTEEFIALFDQQESSPYEDVDPSQARLTTRTCKGATEAQIGYGKLKYYYKVKETGLRIQMPLRKADSLELKIPTADLVLAKDRGFKWMEIIWKGITYRFLIDEWTLELEAEAEVDLLDFENGFADAEGEYSDFDDEGLDVEGEELEEHTGVAEEYVEIRINQKEIAVDACVVEWLNKMTKLVRRQTLH